MDEGRTLMERSFADQMSGRDTNNLNLIRMVAALAVIVSHAFPIAGGRGTPEPLVPLTGLTLGGGAVAAFFCISGLLIAMSYERRKSHWHWFIARGLRLFPALFVVLLLTVFVLGPLVTQSGSYWTAAETWLYVPRNLSLALLQYELPGVFVGNPNGGAINGSLWTLFYEVACYGGVLLAGTLGLLHRPRAFVAVIGLFIVGAAAISTVNTTDGALFRLARLADLGWPFLIGMAAWVYRHHFRLDWRMLAVAWIVALAASITPFGEAVAIFALCYSVLFAAFVPKGAALRYNGLGDYSYGTYIYAFPVQQLLVFSLPGQGWLANVAMAVPITLCFAILSWKLVERPALAQVGSMADRMITPRAPAPVEV